MRMYTVKRGVCKKHTKVNPKWSRTETRNYLRPLKKAVRQSAKKEIKKILELEYFIKH